MKQIKNIAEIVGGGYREFWNCKKMYRVLKGGRASKKSFTAALWYILRMMEYYHKYGLKPNLLVIRRFCNTHRDSTRAVLIKVIYRLGVQNEWQMQKSDMTLIYIPSGQKILFKGLDEPESLTSIQVEQGELCWAWWEEAYQCNSEEAFDKISKSLRAVSAPLFKQHTLTFNPWSERIWIKNRFFDKSDEPKVAALRERLHWVGTTTYLQNEFLTEDDNLEYELLKETNPRKYAIEGLGEWGIAEGLVYNNWEEVDLKQAGWGGQNAPDKSKRPSLSGMTVDKGYTDYFGLDFGYSNSYYAFIAFKHKFGENKIYIYDEIYAKGWLDGQMASEIKARGYGYETIFADSSEPKSIDNLRSLGLNIRPAKKNGGESGKNPGIQKLQEYQFLVHHECKNTINELYSYVWMEDKNTGKSTDKTVKEGDHLMDALRYASEKLGRFSGIIGVK